MECDSEVGVRWAYIRTPHSRDFWMVVACLVDFSDEALLSLWSDQNDNTFLCNFL